MHLYLYLPFSLTKNVLSITSYNSNEPPLFLFLLKVQSADPSIRGSYILNLWKTSVEMIRICEKTG